MLGLQVVYVVMCVKNSVSVENVTKMCVHLCLRLESSFHLTTIVAKCSVIHSFRLCSSIVFIKFVLRFLKDLCFLP